MCINAAIGSRRRLPPRAPRYISRGLPVGSQSHSRISSLCVCARAPFVYIPLYVPIYLSISSLLRRLPGAALHGLTQLPVST